MTDDTIASPEAAPAADPSNITDDRSAARAADRDESTAGIVLVEEISIDGMCGVY